MNFDTTTVGRAKDARHPKAAARAAEKASSERSAMQKRNLRVVKWLGTVPATGTCTFCDRNFKVPMDSLKRTSDAQANLQQQFDAHKCQREDASQFAGPDREKRDRE